MSKTWYSIKAQGENEALIDIFDDIGYFGISARDFIADLRRLGSAINQIRVRINSYGGELFDGIAIFNALKRHEATVIVEVYGIAASVASLIAMAGDKVIMPANTFLFLHDPLALVVGDADDMEDMAADLRKLSAGLVSTYMAKSGKSEKEVKKWMSDDSWFSAQEAFDAGLADEVTDAVKIAANASLARFKNLPTSLKPLAEAEPEKIPPVTDPPALTPEEIAATEKAKADAVRTLAEKKARDILAACNKAGVPEAATDFLDRGLSAEEVQKRLADADKIRARCASAKLPDRANGYIKAGMSVAEVANALFDTLIARQGPEIDAHLSPDAERRTTDKPKTATASEIMAMRNKRE